MIITCCHNCVAPKRYPGCGDHCDEYKAQKQQYEASKQPPVVAVYIAEATERYGSKHYANPHRIRR